MPLEKFASVYQYKEILDIILAFNVDVGYEQLLDTILNKMMDLTNSASGTIYIVKDDKLHAGITKNKTHGINKIMGDEIPPIDLCASNLAIACVYSALNRIPVAINDVYANDQFVWPPEYDKLTGCKTKSVFMFPLISSNSSHSNLLGVLQLANAINDKTGEIISYREVADESVLAEIFSIATTVLSNFLRAQEQGANKMFSALVQITIQAIAERSVYSKNHTQNVAQHCHTFAKFLNNKFTPGDVYYFSESDIDVLTLAAFLHDIGKIVAPLEIMDKTERLGTEILNVQARFTMKTQLLELEYLKGEITAKEYEEQKTYIKRMWELIDEINASDTITNGQLLEIYTVGRITYTSLDGKVVPLLTPENLEALCIRFGTLTEKERKIMQDHVVITSRLLSEISFAGRYKNVPIWAGNHHELLDGSGYPRGLSGDSIDLGSRILTIADIFDSLASNDRPYKKGIPIDRSIEIIYDMARKGKLDQELVRLFVESRAWDVTESNISLPQ